MIYQITKKEYKQIAGLQKNGFHECLVFKLPDGTPYRCDTMGAAGLKEIMRFRVKKKREIQDQQRLAEILER